MKRILLLIIIFLTGFNSFSQPITVSTTTYTVPQLVQDVLFAPTTGSASCVGTISNITWSTGNTGTNGSYNGIGYFTNSNPAFPLSSGVILTTGDVTGTPGPNDYELGDAADVQWPGDQDLFDYMDGLGIDPNLLDYNDATILEFDFTPLTTTMSFDFLFASEEYGVYQCDYSDAFAFFLTNLTAGTPTTNLALIPTTTVPISVVTIRDGAYYSGGGVNCGSSHAGYFGNFNGGAAAPGSATNFNGETVLMTASSNVIPNNVYHIKLVIADRNDNQFDSAVFLGGGSFDIGTPNIAGTGSEFGGFTDFTGLNSVCSSASLVVEAGSAPITGATYAWTLDGNPVGTNSFTYTITQAGVYGVTITYPGGCQQTDSMTVQYRPSLALGTPNDLTQCSAPFNLMQNTPVIQNGVSNPVTYHHTLANAQQQFGAIGNAGNYNGTDGEIIYASVENFATGCIETTQFTLHIDLSLCIVPPIPGTPPDMVQYETTPNSGVSIFNFTPQTAFVYGSNPVSDFTVTYYPTLADANAGTNPITNITAFQNTISPQRIYAVLSDNAHPTNFTVTSFQLIIVALPNVSISGPVAVCSGDSATITFTGTPNATANYTFNGNPAQIPLGPSGTNTFISPPLLLQATFNLVSVTITTAAGTTTQSESGSVVVNITYPPSINTPTDYVVCDDSLDNDALNCNFDLTTKITEITSDPTVQVDFFETATSGSPIPNPSSYCNIVSGNQEIFVRVYDPTTPACYSNTS
ncbi:choice-of-anchor L domain-containing protein, partial [Flavobacterium wongokense]|uniref:choice-of-anchor L domain-containing protein n=1 Tax=Flavobacterium wongokense TaxID=2910674 RepID=UPI001F3429B1